MKERYASKFQNNVLSLHTAPRKCIVCTGGVCTGTNLAVPVQVLTVRSDMKVFTFFTPILFLSMVSSFPVLFYSWLKVYFVYTLTADESVSWKHRKLFSQLTDLCCSGSCIYVFAAAKVPLLEYSTCYPALWSLKTRPIIHVSGFCSIFYIMFFC